MWFFISSALRDNGEIGYLFFIDSLKILKYFLITKIILKLNYIGTGISLLENEIGF